MPPETLFMLLKWLIISVIWLFIAIDLYRDRARVKKLQDSFTVTRLLYTLHKRNLHIYGLVSILLIAMMFNDFGQRTSRMQEDAATSEDVLPEPAETATPAATPVKPPEDSSKFSIPQNPAMPFNNITEFNEKNAKQQAYIDFIKQRYETWLITYYYLQKCGKVGTGDFNIILGALKKELDTTHADSSVQDNIILAATGSYKEMYSEIPCDPVHVDKTKTGYDATMKRLLPPAEKPQLTSGQPAPTAQPAATTAQPAPATQPTPTTQTKPALATQPAMAAQPTVPAQPDTAVQPAAPIQPAPSQSTPTPFKH